MSQTKLCRYCGQVLYIDAETCEYCGRYLLKEHDNKDMFCAKCKAPVNTDDNYCYKCGAVFNVVPQDVEINESFKHNIHGIPYHIGILLTSLAAAFAVMVFAAAGKESTIGGNFIVYSIAFIVAEIFLYIYFLPSIIAIENNHKNALFIYVLNLLLGVTVIGWFVAFFLALNSKKGVQ